MAFDNHQSRRDFLRNLAMGTGGIALFGSLGVIFSQSKDKQTLRAIVVDFSKCAGCRTCENVCSASNHKVDIQGKSFTGLGNPHLSNIKVWHYNPDVDIPVTCFLCEDNPCIKACPVPPDLITGRKALYRDEDLFTIKNDTERCLGCEECANACKNLRGSVIFPNDETGKPERMCTLCNGDPQCVKYCPFDALTYKEIAFPSEWRYLSPDKLATKCMEKIYEKEIKAEV